MVLNSSALNAQYGAQKRTSYAYKINYSIFLWTRILVTMAAMHLLKNITGVLWRSRSYAMLTTNLLVFSFGKG
jgi:hypothetical protein